MVEVKNEVTTGVIALHDAENFHRIRLVTLRSRSLSTRTRGVLLASVAAFLLVLAPMEPAVAATRPAAIPVKVMIITLFGPEAAPWLAQLPIRRPARVPGLSADYPQVTCTATGVCVMTTGTGHANAVASTMALALTPQFDLSHARFIAVGDGRSLIPMPQAVPPPR